VPVASGVTVTRDNGMVPSMSVTWRRLGHIGCGHGFMTTRQYRRAQNPSLDADTRRAGLARLQTLSFAAAAELTADEGWLPRNSHTRIAMKVCRNEACHGDALCAAVMGSSTAEAERRQTASSFAAGLNKA